MRELLILFLALILGTNTVLAYDLELPKEKKSTVNSNYAFFVGKADKTETITINDEKVFIAPNEAFSHSIKLKNGENRIVIRSNYKSQIYKFNKTQKKDPQKQDLRAFPETKYIVIKDNTPLRSTPIDYGMNRISHLFAGTPLILNGQKGDFYQVYLSKDKTAWIAKDAVKESCEKENNIPKFVNMNSEEFKNATCHTIEFTDKLPYSIEETEKELIFKVYNPEYSDNSIYTINIKKPKKYSYKVSLQNGTYMIKISELLPAEATLSGFTIAVDAGHGGMEKGAIGCLGDKEKDINLKIALELKDILEQMGANVVMTRECDCNVSLNDRVQIARDNCANIFVSIHLNSIPDIKMDIHKNRGTSVYYYNQNSKELAKLIENSVSKSIGTRKDGVRAASFAVLRPTDYIGVLVETAYMTNPLDSVIYKTETFPRKTAKAIAESILSYITNE